MDGEVAFLAAFLAGLASFFSPCVFPLLPLYMSVIAPEAGTRSEALKAALAFVSGFTLVFILMGLTASALGALLFEWQDALRKAGGVLMVIMGLWQLGLLPLNFLARDWRPLLSKNIGGGAFVLGMSFVFGWIPCTGPVLSAILLYAGTEADLYYGAWLLLLYSAGFALPLIMLALATERLAARRRDRLTPWLEPLQKVAGAVLIIVGVMLYFNWLARFLALIM